MLVVCCTGRSAGFGVYTDETVRVGEVRAVGHQASGSSKLAPLVDRGHRVLKRKRRFGATALMA
jgi:hypothetical protein